MPLNPLRSATHGAGLGAKHNPLAVVTAAVFALLCSLGDTRAQNYPNHPVRMIVPFGAGGPADVYARVVGQALGEALGQQFVIDNRPGAGAVIGTDIAAKATPDGYTLYFNASIHSINPLLYKKMNFDPTQFEPVAIMTTIANVLLVRKDFPAKNAQEFIAYIKANPGKVNVSTTGSGGSPHLNSAWFHGLTGSPVTFVHYKAAAAGQADLMDVVQAVGNAEMTLQTVVAVRDKVVNAYQELMRMPI